ncbi:hypothetical protein NL108_001350, partial [Boleophthalmus pectinirostris]
VMSHAEAANAANLIFLCVHRDHYAFMLNMEPHLQGKVLVDISNNLKKNIYPESNAEYLQRLVPGAAVVKGLNTLSAWTLQNGPLQGKQTFICGDSAEAKQAVSEVCTRLGLWVVDRGSVGASRELEDFPLQLFPEWRLPLSIAAGLGAAFFIYLLIRDVVYSYVEDKKDISFKIMVALPNKVLPTVSLIMLSLCYLPGVIAAFIQIYRGTKYRRFPNWLDRWMLCRKQIGVLALGCALMHVLYIFVLPIRYSARHRFITQVVNELKNNKTTPFYFDTRVAWAVDSLMGLGILGFFLFVLLGITSLPSVGASLSWREFNFIQSKLGYLTLFICTAHCYIYGWKKLLSRSTYKWYTPPGYMLCLITPSVVLVLKAILLLPCVNRTLTRIRQGWERAPPTGHLEKQKATNF